MFELSYRKDKANRKHEAFDEHREGRLTRRPGKAPASQGQRSNALVERETKEVIGTVSTETTR